MSLSLPGFNPSNAALKWNTSNRDGRADTADGHCRRATAPAHNFWKPLPSSPAVLAVTVATATRHTL